MQEKTHYPTKNGTRALEVIREITFSTDPADFHYIDVNIPCQAACPAQTNIPGYIRTLFEKRYDEAEAEARLALEVEPQDGMGLVVLAEALAARGRHEEALEVARRGLHRDRAWILGRQLALAGRTDEARAIATEMKAEPPDPWRAWTLAVLYATLGEKDDAYRWLNYENIHCWVIGLGSLNFFENLWDDARYPDMMRRMGLPLEHFYD